MKHKGLFFLFIILTQYVISQEAIHNFGALQMHDNVNVGFHIDLTNDGTFDKNSGLAGFYGYNKSLTISGNSEIVFYDTEIAVDNGLYLNTPLGVINNANLIIGNIITPRNETTIYTNFINDAFYAGENDAALINGYASISNKDNFTFPIGDDNYLRPLTIKSSTPDFQTTCAYFYENPIISSTFAKSFKTKKKESNISVSTLEFWHLQSAAPSTVTLTWNERSDVRELGKTIDELKVVGWHIEKDKWVNLGNVKTQGTMSNGSITSEVFTPNDYKVLTIGGIDKKLNEFATIELNNYFITPNGDGKNDYLVLPGLENSPNNELKIFNRYGALVYSKLNYQNDFNGISNKTAILSGKKSLPDGVYFYIITMLDIRQRHQGYLYMAASK